MHAAWSRWGNVFATGEGAAADGHRHAQHIPMSFCSFHGIACLPHKSPHWLGGPEKPSRSACQPCGAAGHVIEHKKRVFTFPAVMKRLVKAEAETADQIRSKPSTVAPVAPAIHTVHGFGPQSGLGCLGHNLKELGRGAGIIYLPLKFVILFVYLYVFLTVLEPNVADCRSGLLVAAIGGSLRTCSCSNILNTSSADI